VFDKEMKWNEMKWNEMKKKKKKKKKKKRGWSKGKRTGKIIISEKVKQSIMISDY
jgi:hypothetical protein